MPTKVRLYSATFNNAHQRWVSTLPASSEPNFIAMYGDNPNVRLQIHTIEHLGHFYVELDAPNYIPQFYIMEYDLLFNEYSQGYNYLYNYFSDFVNRVRAAQEEYHREMGY